MNFKEELLNETLNESKNNLYNIVNKLVNDTLNKKKDEFIDSLNINSEIFPNPIEKGLFRFCGKCYKCKNKENDISLKEQPGKNTSEIMRIKEQIDILNEITFLEERFNLYNNEYLIACSLNLENTFHTRSNNIYLLSNYSRIILLDVSNRKMYNYNNINRDNSIIGKKYSWIKNQHGGGNKVSQIIISKYNDKFLPLSQEYIDIFNYLSEYLYRNINPNSIGYSQHYEFNNLLFNRIIHIYKKYHPKATEIFTIEQKTLKLKDKEIEIKILEDNYLKKYEELSNKEDELIKKEIKLENDIKVHKEKIKHLFKREHNVKLKESINSCKNELLQSAFKLNDVISIIPWPEDDDYDLIKQNIDNVISIMNNLTQ